MNHEPVRPMPVCTSSTANSAPASDGRRRGGGQVAGRGGQHAALPQHRLEQHHRGLLAHGAGQRVGVPVGHVPDAAGQRRERGGLDGWPVRASAPMVRPWKDALGGDHLGPAGEPADLERRLVGLGAGVAEEDPARPAGEVEQPLGQRQAGLVHRQVGDVAELVRLRGDRLDDLRVRVAEDRRRDAAEQVGVLAAVDVPDRGARAAGQRDRRRLVVAHHHGRPAGGQLLGARHRAVPSSALVGRDDHRPGALGGEHLQQQGVRHAAVDDGRPLHARPRPPAGRRPSSGPSRRRARGRISASSRASICSTSESRSGQSA